MAQLNQDLYNTQGNRQFTFASFPDSKIYADENTNDWTQHLIFGDYIKILDLEVVNKRIKVNSRKVTGWIPIENIQRNKTLEVNFIDIGQGDACHLVTPKDEHYIIDAGKGDNMFRYLYWRFNLDENKTLPFKFQGIISHPDNDHFLGFKELFESKSIQFENIYHSGVVQRPKRNELGWNTEIGKVEKLSNGKKYLISLVKSDSGFNDILSDIENLSGKGSQYLSTLNKVLSQPERPKFITLNKNTGFLTGMNGNNEFSFEILAPIIENIDGKEVLPFFKSNSKTKNGHSILIKLKYKNLRVMLGGDINEEAGNYINGKLGQSAKSTLQVDVAKACHHGSHLFSYEFLENINALGTIISSGDDENYSHPRPDTLGALGKTGYSSKPLIFSTELARSNKEFSTSTIPDLVKKYQDWEVAKKEFESFAETFVDTAENNETLKKLEEKEKSTYKAINSYLTRYGMINLRSDGKKMIIAQKLERDSRSSKYDIYKFKYDENEKRFVRTK